MRGGCCDKKIETALCLLPADGLTNFSLAEECVVYASAELNLMNVRMLPFSFYGLWTLRNEFWEVIIHNSLHAVVLPKMHLKRWIIAGISVLLHYMLSITKNHAKF
jgi:hypothetical protein